MVDWSPPSHRDAAQIHVCPSTKEQSLSGNWLTSPQLLFLQSDGGYDIHKQLLLSGEPLIAPLRDVFKLEPPFSAIKCQELAIQGRNSCEAYSDYWNRMAEDDGTTTQY